MEAGRPASIQNNCARKKTKDLQEHLHVNLALSCTTLQDILLVQEEWPFSCIISQQSFKIYLHDRSCKYLRLARLTSRSHKILGFLQAAGLQDLTT